MFVFPVASPFRLRVSHHLDRATFPVPATSNAACGFPRTALSCLFRSKAYGTYHAKTTFGGGRPSASSVTLMSATLICVAVGVFSKIEALALASATAVGASFTSVRLTVINSAVVLTPSFAETSMPRGSYLRVHTISLRVDNPPGEPQPRASAPPTAPQRASGLLGSARPVTPSSFRRRGLG